MWSLKGRTCGHLAAQYTDRQEKPGDGLLRCTTIVPLDFELVAADVRITNPDTIIVRV